jgi:hypothetical protein
MQNVIKTLFFNKPPFFAENWAKIAENCDHDIVDPRFSFDPAQTARRSRQDRGSAPAAQGSGVGDRKSGRDAGVHLQVRHRGPDGKFFKCVFCAYGKKI